jgi:ABC-type transporter MlaC component
LLLVNYHTSVQPRLILTFVFFLVFAMPAAPASVSSSRQSCIRNAMTAGSAALGSPARLNTLYERYFAGERIAQLSAGKDWKRYTAAQKDAQRNRVRRFVVQVLAPSFAGYKGSRVKFLSESGSKVRGVVTGPNGERRTVTWHFAGSCKFINVSIEGFGSLISLIGREQTRK